MELSGILTVQALCVFSCTARERVARRNRERTLFVTTLAPPTAGERVARRNRQRMLVVATPAPPNGRREGRKD